MSTIGIYTGGCQCGNIRYELECSEFRLCICHCSDCQKQSGSAFGMSLIVPPGSFRLVSGKLKSFQVEADSGRVKTCSFCADCGVRIRNQTSAITSIKAGTLDDTSWLTPDEHYWTDHKQNWVLLNDETPLHPKDN